LLTDDLAQTNKSLEIAQTEAKPTTIRAEQSSYIIIMNKAELVDAIAIQAEVTKKEADTILSAAIEVIMETVAANDKVTLVGFGTFEPRDRQAREGRNPATGAAIKIPATTVPAFSAGKGFKEKVGAAKAAKGKKK
jgi:DNA-binding protein HU-beta